jgi:hypothetical protein
MTFSLTDDPRLAEKIPRHSKGGRANNQSLISLIS